MNRDFILLLFIYLFSFFCQDYMMLPLGFPNRNVELYNKFGSVILQTEQNITLIKSDQDFIQKSYFK